MISTDHTTVPTRLRHLILALAIPLFLGAGVALAYLGAFHDPTPRHLRVEVATTSPASTAPLVSALATRVGQQFEISVRSPTQAAADVAAARVTAAYRQGTKPQLLVNTAASPTAEQAAVQLFSTVAAITEHAPLSVHDFGPQPASDPLSQNLFFLLVALTIGGYSGAIAIGAAGERLPARTRAGIAVAMAGVIALLGVLIAGPLYGAVHGHLPELAAIAWLYVSGVMLIGTGLHAFLGRLTTPALVGLFVMLNFTTSGGVYDPALQSSFFRALSHVWNGDAFIAATRDVLYRSGTGTTAAITRLGIWALAGLALTAVAIWRENHHADPLAAPARASEERELEQLIVAA